MPLQICSPQLNLLQRFVHPRLRKNASRLVPLTSHFPASVCNSIPVTRFSVERDPSLANYFGLGGEANREKLAETFKRPTTWGTYCQNVSTTNCTVADGVAARAPAEDEAGKYFSAGAYTGHFRKTAKNDCCEGQCNCTGHFMDYPVSFFPETVRFVELPCIDIAAICVSVGTILSFTKKRLKETFLLRVCVFVEIRNVRLIRNTWDPLQNGFRLLCLYLENDFSQSLFCSAVGRVM